MNPELQDDTFASTVAGIEDLRRSHQDNDWHSWKRTLVASANSGKRLEQGHIDLKAAVEQCVRKTRFDKLEMRVMELEGSSRRVRSLSASALSLIWQLLLLILAGYLGHAWK